MGTTANLPARLFQHKNGTSSGFCREHGLNRLVYIEEYDSPYEAIAREQAMKAWKRRWKTDLIIKANPDWDDLWDVINS
ncbi:MAG: GIY-YIG nuclease family protein [Parasphingorhabdus sp.]